jgi:hypothetical protein
LRKQKLFPCKANFYLAIDNSLYILSQSRKDCKTGDKMSARVFPCRAILGTARPVQYRGGRVMVPIKAISLQKVPRKVIFFQKVPRKAIFISKVPRKAIFFQKVQRKVISISKDPRKAISIQKVPRKAISI